MKRKALVVLGLTMVVLTGCSYSEYDRVISGAIRFVQETYIPRVGNPDSYVLEDMELIYFVKKGILVTYIDDYLEEVEKKEQRKVELQKERSGLRDELSDNRRETTLASSSAQSSLIKRNELIRKELGEAARELREINRTIRNNNMVVDKIQDWVKHHNHDEIVYFLLVHHFSIKNSSRRVVNGTHEVLYFPKSDTYVFDSCPIHHSPTSKALRKLKEADE